MSSIYGTIPSEERQPTEHHSLLHHPSQPVNQPDEQTKPTGMAQNNKTNRPVVLSPAEKRSMGVQIRAAKKKALERRPNNIAKRWSRNIQGLHAGDGGQGGVRDDAAVCGQAANDEEWWWWW
ncbi:hypothetical protein VMCG_08205 [Cytospora schulzeri]|uniref:Uncharacterized protein n=1 Tax=Cytospora schulzeri TaxID=448051 RepID=A0A423VU15_9PEZI|nr:hypothetical protein VMCG_08205 [Valsa malicola]